MPQQIDEDPHARAAISDAARRILQRGDQKMHRNQLVPTLVLECCRHVAPDIGVQRVQHALQLAVHHGHIACTPDGWYTPAGNRRNTVSSSAAPGTNTTTRHRSTQRGNGSEPGDRRSVVAPIRAARSPAPPLDAARTKSVQPTAPVRQTPPIASAPAPARAQPTPEAVSATRPTPQHRFIEQVVVAAVRRIQAAPRRSVDEQVLLTTIARQCFPTWGERRARDEVVRQLQAAIHAGVLVRQQGSYALGPHVALVTRR